MAITNIGIVGLGAMGTPIATRVMKAGYVVKGFDVLEKRMACLVPLGLQPTKSPNEAARGVDLVILSLPNWTVIQEVVEGGEGILTAAKKGQAIIDTSTVPPSETRAMARRMAKRGIYWMDVPISGSARQAKDGNIVFMAGGERSVFDRIKPVLDRVGKKTLYVGKHGDAAMLKLIVNQTLFLNQAAAIEGLVLGLKAGLDPDVMLDVLTSGAASSDLIAARGPDMIRANFRPKGALWIAIKDLGYALESARELGAVLPVTGLYQQLLLSARQRGWDESDATVVMRIYEELAGIKRGRRPKKTRGKTP